LFAGLSKPIDLRLVSRQELRSGAVAIRYEPKRVAERPRDDEAGGRLTNRSTRPLGFASRRVNSIVSQL
jgi:hypothetical protein